MKQLALALLISILTACSNYREPRANCFAFVAQGPGPLDCDFESLGRADLGDIANE